MKSIYILVLICLSFLNANAQKFELGKVSFNELSQKFYPLDSSASASILYCKAKTIFTYQKKGFSVKHEYEFRIKIYKNQGLKWADFKVPYYVGYETINKDYVKFSDGVTYNLENGKIEKTKLKSEGTFRKNLHKYWDESSISMPNVKIGSVIEFKYTITSENLVSFPVFNFQYDIPVQFSEYQTQIPEFFIYKPLTTGFNKINTDVKIGTGYQHFEDEHKQSLNMSYKQINSIHKVENLPAIKNEDFVDNLQNYKSAIHYELEKTRFPESEEKNYALTWNDVAKNIYNQKDFGKELEDKSYFPANFKSILQDQTTEIEKTNAVLKFVQNKMNWNNEYSYSTDKGVKKAYIEETGNSAEINFILISMLNYAGINANPVLLSTKKHGIPVYPNRTIFNHVIASAEIDGKIILMDAINKNSTLNILPSDDLNWIGRLIRKDESSQEVNLVSTTNSFNGVNLMATIENSGIVKGKAKFQKSDYFAMDFRENFLDVNKENYIEKLETKLWNLKVTDYTIENSKTDFRKPVVETFNFISDNVVEILNDKMYINPLLFLTENKNPFKQESRQMPVYLGFPKLLKYNIILQIPDGYQIETLPKSINLTTGENIAFFKSMMSSTNNTIQISIILTINSTIIASDYYDALKDFYKQMIDKQNEKIVLKKI